MQVKRTSNFSNAVDVNSHPPALVFRSGAREAEGETYDPFACGRSDERKCQITTANHRSIPEPITKGKLALEVAKLVKRCIEVIKVSVVFYFHLLFFDIQFVRLKGAVEVRRSTTQC